MSYLTIINKLILEIIFISAISFVDVELAKLFGGLLLIIYMLIEVFNKFRVCDFKSLFNRTDTKKMKSMINEFFGEDDYADKLGLSYDDVTVNILDVIISSFNLLLSGSMIIIPLLALLGVMPRINASGFLFVYILAHTTTTTLVDKFGSSLEYTINEVSCYLDQVHNE